MNNKPLNNEIRLSDITLLRNFMDELESNGKFFYDLFSEWHDNNDWRNDKKYCLANRIYTEDEWNIISQINDLVDAVADEYYSSLHIDTKQNAKLKKLYSMLKTKPSFQNSLMLLN